MTTTKFFSRVQRLSIAMALLACFYVARAQTGTGSSQPLVGPGNVFVHPTKGGTILGFDIDQNGTEGLLSEFLTLGNGACPYATETFDQESGKIIKIVNKGDSYGCGDGDVTWGVSGPSVGLVMHEHSITFDHVANTYLLLNPLEGNQITGPWNLDNKAERVYGVSRNQSTPVNAFQVFNYLKQLEYVFGSDVAGNEFGPVVQLGSYAGIVGLNAKTNTAVLAGGGQPFGPSYVYQISLASGKVTTFLGIGSGMVQGIAVDSADNIAVTTTFGDAGVEFYDLTNQTGFEETLPGIPQNCDNACAGVDVEFDPIHRVFLVAQPISSQQLNSNTSTIYVYDTQGNLQETLNGFDFFTQRFDVYPVHIALHPSDRTGFVDVTNSLGVGALQSFTY
jgi:hypothetical protein